MEERPEALSPPAPDEDDKNEMILLFGYANIFLQKNRLLQLCFAYQKEELRRKTGSM